MKKRILSAFVCIAIFAALMPAALANSVVTRVSYRGDVKKESILYIGEVFLNGVSDMVYVYSDDATCSEELFSKLSIGLNDTAYEDILTMAASQYADNARETGCAYSTAHQAEMNDSWKNAKNVALEYYSGIVTEYANADMYEKNENFKAVCDEVYASVPLTDADYDRTGKLLTQSEGSSSVDVISYKVEDGQIVEYVDTVVGYSFDAVTVVYTRADVTETIAPLKIGDYMEMGTILRRADFVAVRGH